ncbi:hypothetical protein [Aeromonas media]|uniref:hypothetical protein n=1 Tax=Aeromonas media TaxID=651 RepID=UPI00370C691A
MYKLLTYPLNIALILFFGLMLSLLKYSYFYETPNFYDILLIIVIIIPYVILSLFFKRSDAQVKINFDCASSEESRYLETRSLYMISISLVGFIIEFIYGGLPILVGREVARTIPFFHVLFYSMTLCSVLYAVIFSSKKIVIICLMFASLISILTMSRQLIMVVFMIALIAFFSKHSITKKSFCYLLLSIVFVIIAFGFLGNLRQSLSGDFVDNYIQIVGGATEKGEKIGDILFWIWLYISSPIYNLIFNYNTYIFSEPDIFKVDGLFFYSNILPDTISKYLYDGFKIDLVMAHLNVGTGYAAAIRNLGLLGFLLLLIYQLLFYIVFLTIVDNKHKLMIVTYFSALSFFMIFDNLFVRAEFVFVFIIVFLSSHLKLKVVRPYKLD